MKLERRITLLFIKRLYKKHEVHMLFGMLVLNLILKRVLKYMLLNNSIRIGKFQNLEIANLQTTFTQINQFFITRW